MAPVELTQESIQSTGDWYLSEHINLMEGYFWKHKSISKDGYTYYMKRFVDDGHTTISEMFDDEIIIFQGYVETLSDLNDVVRLLKIREL